MSVFALCGYGVAIGGRRLVGPIDLDIAAGQCVALVGESGSGKSLTAMTPFGLSAGTGSGGAMLCDERLDPGDLAGLRRARARHCGFIFQQPLAAMTPHQRVGALLTEAAMQAGGTRPGPAALAAMLTEVGLGEVGLTSGADWLGRYPHQLSGGERQRVCIAAALAHNPALLIADEPTTALDAVLRREIMALLDELRARRGLAMLLVSHDLASVAAHADVVVVMQAGAVVESGPAAALIDAPTTPYGRALR
ncbi:MAG: hypothetical protein RLZZ58_1130, partial [Pseudomonadota bacterium]